MTRTVGKRIEELRLQHGYNRKELAKRANIDPTYISKIERSERTNISPYILDAICTALDYPLSDLLYDIGLGRQNNLDKNEDWQRDVIRAFRSLPSDIQAVQLKILLMLEAEAKRQKAMNLSQMSE